MTACRVALMVMAMADFAIALPPPGVTPLARLAASMDGRIDAALASEKMEMFGWLGLAELASAYRAKAGPTAYTTFLPERDWIPGVRADISGPDFSGYATISATDGGTSGVGVGWFLRNQERRKAEGFLRMAGHAREKAALLKRSALLDGLKHALSIRNVIVRMEEEERRRIAFDSYLGSLLERLRPYAENLAVPPNSLNNLRNSREANLLALSYLRQKRNLMIKDASELHQLDTADLLGIDIKAVVDTVEAARRKSPGPRMPYRSAVDSMEAVLTKERIGLERQGEDRLWLGMEVLGSSPFRASPEAAVGLRLEWSATFGAPKSPAFPAPARLQAVTTAPSDSLASTLQDARVEEAMRNLQEHVERRLLEIKLGQSASVNTISESLGYLLSYGLQSVEAGFSFRGHVLAGIQSLDELGLAPLGGTP